MKTVLSKITCGLLVLLMSNAVLAQYNMLFVGNSDNAIDYALGEYFILEGYNVTFVEEAAFKDGAEYTTADGYSGFDVLFASESIGSGSVNNYRDAGFPIPCVTTEAWVVKSNKWGMLSDDSETYFRQANSTEITADVLTIVITNNEHWITQDYDQGYHLVWATAPDPTQLGVNAFNLNEDVDGALPLGEFLFDMGGLPTVWAIPEGSTIQGTTALPNIVIIGIIQTYREQEFTGDFLQFLLKCVRWVTDDYEIESVHSPLIYNLAAGPNPTTGTVNVSLTLPEAGNIRINIYDIAGRLLGSVNPGYLSAGFNTIQIDFSDMPAAVYCYEITTNTDTLKGKIIRK